MPPLDPRPEPGREPAEEEALRRKKTPGEPGLEEADAGPGRGYGARQERRGAERPGEEAVDGGHGEVVQAAEARQE